jgi:hypothetical protein
MIRFADTFFYLAVVNPHDLAHAPALALSRNFRGRVVTTEFILLELADAMSAPPISRSGLRRASVSARERLFDYPPGILKRN